MFIKIKRPNIRNDRLQECFDSTKFHATPQLFSAVHNMFWLSEVSWWMMTMRFWGFLEMDRLLGEQHTSAYSQRHTVCQTSRKREAKAQKKEGLGRCTHDGDCRLQWSVAAVRIQMSQIYLGGSIVPRSPVFSASSPAPPPESRESFRSRKHVNELSLLSGAFAVVWRARRSTCWSGVGAVWPCFFHGWFPGELWPETWGRRWTEASAEDCSRFLPRAAVPSLRTRITRSNFKPLLLPSSRPSFSK